jgi:hypothetical protein
MTTVGLRFADRLREALVADPAARFVFLGNFEVEEMWAAGTGRLPGSGVKSSAAVVNRMEEFALSVASDTDFVILKDAVDAGFAAHLADQGLRLPQTLVVDHNRPELMITADALASPRLIARLRGLADGRTYLLPLGASELEERLSAATGLPLAVPAADVFRKVNSKAYSRWLGDELELRSAPGHSVSTLSELRALEGALVDMIDRVGRIVVKEVLGVSGKGVVVIDRPRRLAQLIAMLERRAQRSGDQRLGVIVEQWIEKRCDLNYQFVIASHGAIALDFVKEAVTERGVHKGHVMPSRLSADQIDELRDSAAAIGERLYGDGYHGVVGVDAILGADGELYPILEINARFNMSSYQTDIAERFVGSDRVALARHYPMRLGRRRSFAEFAAQLGSVLFDPARETGFLVNNFAAVNAAAGSGEVFDGRLYGLCIAESHATMSQLDNEVEARLAALQEGRNR